MPSATDLQRVQYITSSFGLSFASMSILHTLSHAASASTYCFSNTVLHTVNSANVGCDGRFMLSSIEYRNGLNVIHPPPHPQAPQQVHSISHPPTGGYLSLLLHTRGGTGRTGGALPSDVGAWFPGVQT